MYVGLQARGHHMVSFQSVIVPLLHLLTLPRFQNSTLTQFVNPVRTSVEPLECRCWAVSMCLLLGLVQLLLPPTHLNNRIARRLGPA